jgi:hypothetical protein
MTSAFINGKQTYVHRIQRFHGGVLQKPLCIEFREELEKAIRSGEAKQRRDAPREAKCKCGNIYAAEHGRNGCYACTKYADMPSDYRLIGKNNCDSCGVEFAPSSKGVTYCKKKVCQAARADKLKARGNAILTHALTQ